MQMFAGDAPRRSRFSGAISGFALQQGLASIASLINAYQRPTTQLTASPGPQHYESTTFERVSVGADS